VPKFAPGAKALTKNMQQNLCTNLAEGERERGREGERERGREGEREREKGKS
jgi:hypothetical protein